MTRLVKIMALVAVSLSAFCLPLRAAELIEIKNISDDASVKLLIRLKEEAKASSFVLSNPPRVVIDFPGAAQMSEQKYDDALLKGARVGKPYPETVRVVLDLAFLMPYTIVPHEGGPSLVVEIPRKLEDKKRSKQPLPGIDYSATETMTPAGPMAYHVLEVDLADPNISLGMCIGEDRLGGLESLSSMVKRKGAAIGVNGGYFNTENGAPIDLLIVKGKALTLPDRFRGFFGVDNKGKPVFIRPNAEIGVRADGQKSYFVHRLNIKPNKGEIAVFTPEFGKKTGTAKGRREVVVRGDKISAFGDGDTAIPADGYVLSADDSQAEFLTPLAVGGSVKLLLSSYPDIRNIAYGVSAGPMLVREGAIQANLIEDFTFTSQIITARNPRTAVGATADNRLIFVVVEGRSTRSIGMTLDELASLMKNLGAVDAVNLDGGGSSAMAIGDKIMNELPSGERKIANGFMIYYKSK
ncbi:MAG TPA: phosphodiester glycosidase family protein [bacterium]|nr:phosphodiester glycosidase family protein [bacterium]